MRKIEINKLAFKIFFLFISMVFVVVISPIGDFGNRIRLARANVNDNVYGFAWNSNFGWISFNSIDCDADCVGPTCTSDGLPAGCPPPAPPFYDYGVNVDMSDGSFDGYAWSSNLGWISFQELNPPDAYAFNANCNTVGSCTGNCTACFNASDRNVYGWAKVLALGNDGWIKFYHDDVISLPPFSFTGGQQSWVVPAGVTSITVDAAGASGAGTNNQGGARVQATVATTPGETLYINVGGAGSGTSGGFNGGGRSWNSGFGGGGASDIRRGLATLNDRIVVAAGGGGSGSCVFGGTGGDGGDPNGDPGANSGGTTGGGGATQVTWGAAGNPNGNSGALGVGGNGGNSTCDGGGGGGGYYGGGGGGANNLRASGGGGGSSWATNPISYWSHSRMGDGQVTISYTSNIFKVSYDYISKTFSGWAWNANDNGHGIGWTSFNCLNPDAGGCAGDGYRVGGDLNSPPTAVNLVYGGPQSPCSYDLWLLLDWDSDDEEDDPVYDPDRPFGLEIAIKKSTDGWSNLAAYYIDPNTNTSQYIYRLGGDGVIIPPEYATTYNWRVKVKDSVGSWSSWTNGPDFMSYAHKYPDPSVFEWVPTEISAKEPISFISTTSAKCYVTGSTEVDCDDTCGWFWSTNPPTSTISPNANDELASTTVITFDQKDDVDITLQLTDQDGFICPATKPTKVKLRLPTWIERK